MTKEEAIQAMREGKKVTHEYCSDDEYLYERNDGKIVTEEGYTVTNDFWSYRTSPGWQINWSVIN